MNGDTTKIRIDETEPKALSTAAPVIVFIALAIGLYWGGLYLNDHGGGFSAKVYQPFSSEKVLAAMQPPTEGGAALAKGKQVFGTTCGACHQASGLGMPGQFPPLVGSEWVIAPNPERAIRIVLNGLTGPITVKGVEFNNTMVPWRDALNDEDIAAVVTYIRQEWGNKASAVTAEQVKKVRDATADKVGAWTADEVSQVPEK